MTEGNKGIGRGCKRNMNCGLKRGKVNSPSPIFLKLIPEFKLKPKHEALPNVRDVAGNAL
jgi:hypothetical protein